MDTVVQADAMLAGHTELSSWLATRGILGVYDQLVEVCLICFDCPVLTARVCQLGVHNIANLKLLDNDDYVELRQLKVSAFGVKTLKRAIADGAFARLRTCVLL
jgi:hypothetical protein